MRLIILILVFIFGSLQAFAATGNIKDSLRGVCRIFESTFGIFFKASECSTGEKVRYFINSKKTTRSNYEKEMKEYLKSPKSLTGYIASTRFTQASIDKIKQMRELEAKTKKDTYAYASVKIELKKNCSIIMNVGYFYIGDSCKGSENRIRYVKDKKVTKDVFDSELKKYIESIK